MRQGFGDDRQGQLLHQWLRILVTREAEGRRKRGPPSYNLPRAAGGMPQIRPGQQPLRGDPGPFRAVHRRSRRLLWRARWWPSR